MKNKNDTVQRQNEMFSPVYNNKLLDSLKLSCRASYCYDGVMIKIYILTSLFILSWLLYFVVQVTTAENLVSQK